MDSFTSVEVCKIIGITYRQLCYWEKTGLITASVDPGIGTGSVRRFSFGELAQLRLIKKMLDGGIGLKRIRRLLEVLETHALPTGGDDLVLLFSGLVVHVATTPGEVVDVLRRYDSVVAINVGRMMRWLKRDVEDRGYVLA